MPGLILMTALGHKGIKSPSELENLVHAGLGYYAHAGNVGSSGHQVIDEAQHVTSSVMQDAGELPVVISAKLPHVQQSVSHTWTTTQMNVNHIVGEHIPHQLGWL